MIIKLIQPKMCKRPMDSGLKAQMAPSLGLLTIANMLQDKHTIIYENENTAPINYDEKVDIVGISITVDVFPRAKDIAKKFQEKNIPVVYTLLQIQKKLPNILMLYLLVLQKLHGR